jgi:uncharacterized membrane protein YidH (DUF202 family)
MTIKRFVILIFLAGAVALSYTASLPQFAHAADTKVDDPCIDANGNYTDEEWCLNKFKEDPAGLADPAKAKGYFGDVLSTVINLLLIAGALGAFAMFAYGGFRYMTAQDDAGKTKQARDTMQYAAVGLIIMSMVYVFMLIYNNILPHS